MNSRVYLKVMVAGLAGTSVLFSACVPGSRSELNDKELVGKQLFLTSRYRNRPDSRAEPAMNRRKGLPIHTDGSLRKGP